MTDELKQAVERLEAVLLDEEHDYADMVSDAAATGERVDLFDREIEVLVRDLRTVLDALSTARRDAFEEAAKSAERHGETQMSFAELELPISPGPIIAKDRAATANLIAAAIRALADSPAPDSNQPPVDGDLWVENWYGSNPGKGASVWSLTEYGTRKNMLFHVGDGAESLELARIIVSEHNASLRTLADSPAPVDADTGQVVAWASSEEMREAHLTIQKSFLGYVKKRSGDDHLDTPLFLHPAPVDAERNRQ